MSFQFLLNQTIDDDNDDDDDDNVHQVRVQEHKSLYFKIYKQLP